MFLMRLPPFFLFLFGIFAAWGQTPLVSIELTGVPPGYAPALEVTLPSGKKTAVSHPAEFAGLEPGKYRLTGEAFRIPGEIVDTVLEAPVAEILVKAGEKKVLRLNYTKRGGTGILWTATARIDEDTDDFTKGAVRGIDEATLLAAGFSKGTAEILTGPRLYGGLVAADGAFLFVDGWDSSALMRLPAAALAKGGKPLKLPGTEVLQYALDPKGNLWELSGARLRRYPAGSWSSGITGKPSAEFTLATEEEAALPANRLLFSAEGDLLLCDRGRIARFAASSLASSRTLARQDAKAFLEFAGGSTGQAALDANGDLWLTDENSEVVQIARSQWEKGGTTEGTRYSVPQSVNGVAVDNSGGVWILIRHTGQIFHRPAGGGEFTEKGVFGRGFSDFSTLTFNPPPPWSPLVQPGMPRRLEAAK